MQKLTRTQGTVAKCFAILSLLIALWLIGIQISYYFRQKAFLSRAIETEATIVDLYYSSRRCVGPECFTTVYTYTDPAGVNRINWNAGRVGEPNEKINVWVDPERPSRSQLLRSSPYDRAETTVPMAFLFGLVALVSFAFYRSSRW